MMGIRRIRIICSIVVSIIGVTGCQTTPKQYTLPLDSLFEKSKKIEGISALAKPIFREDEMQTYFGIDMLESGILPVYIAVRNDNPKYSFIIDDESINLQDSQYIDKAVSPSRKIEKQVVFLEKHGLEVGTIIPIAGAVINVTRLAKKIDSVMIDENFEYQRLRSHTIDPAKVTSGFVYFNSDQFKSLDKTDICYNLLNPSTDETVKDCINLKLKGIFNDDNN